MIDAANEYARTVWTAAVAHADAQFQQQRHEHAEAQSEWLAERSELTALIDSVANEVDECRATSLTLKERLEACASEAETHKIAAANHKSAFDREATRADELEKRVADLKDEIGRANSHISDLIKAAVITATGGG